MSARLVDPAIAHRMWRAGTSDRDIAAHFGASTGAVQNVLRKWRKQPRVPTRMVRPILEDWLRKQEDGSLESLSLRCGVSIKALYMIRYECAAWSEMATVDRLLVAMERPDIWHTHLAEYYEAEVA